MTSQQVIQALKENQLRNEKRIAIANLEVAEKLLKIIEKGVDK